MAETLDVSAFLERSRHVPVLDVRTPAEFAQGHIPRAHNLPLFSDEERAEVGTLYKHAGRDEALLKGLDLVGPRLPDLVRAARSRLDGEAALVHCWRGGMRSEAVAWLLEFVGCRVGTLRGGYKAFRRYALATFGLPRRLRLLGGMTGSGKTEALRALARRGEQVLDLEGLARHKGSVFGHLGEPAQPTQEYFENELAVLWRALDPARPVWVEDESRRIGRVLLPEAVWSAMQQASVYVLEVPFAARAAYLVEHYGAYDAALLSEAVGAIGKRLGGLRTKQARQALRDGDVETACRLLLAYYDRAYTYGLARRAAVRQRRVPAPTPADPDALADALLAATRCAGQEASGVSVSP